MLLYCCALLGAATAAAAPDVAAGLKPGWYEIAEISIRVADRKSNGDTWDAMRGAPDPEIEIDVDGRKVGGCRKLDDAHEYTCRPAVLIELRAESTITLRVVDIDVSNDDRIGDAVARGLTTDGRLGVAMPLTTEGELALATLTLGRGRVPKYWTSTRILYAVIGLIATILAVAYMFSRRTAAPASAPAATPATGHQIRCPFCQHLVAAGTSKCPHCHGKI